jgi:membrane peptidoglycan carboxypeptidase
MEPYYVEKIVASDGTVVYQHQPQPVQVISPDVANASISVLKGVLTNGTGRKGRLDGNRPAAGKTGTQSFNTNAWFVGATPQYTAAVWMGDPKGQTRMRNVPEFVRNGVNPVHGGDYPVQIWKYFMDASSAFLPPEDWPAPPAPTRPARRIFLPGEECVFRAKAAAAPVAPVDPNAPPAAPPAVSFGVDKKATGAPVPPEVLDMAWPLTSVPASTPVFDCRKGPPPPAPAPAPTAGAPAPAATPAPKP